jgi:hypothetical protein
MAIAAAACEYGAGRGASSPHPSVTYVPWAGSVSGQDLMPHNKLASKLRLN